MRMHVTKCARCGALSEPREDEYPWPDGWRTESIGLGDWDFCPACAEGWNEAFEKSNALQRDTLSSFLGDLWAADCWEALQQDTSAMYNAKGVEAAFRYKMSLVQAALDDPLRIHMAPGRQGCKACLAAVKEASDGE